MSVIALASANGSPGVTSTALGLALTWPRPVILVDADPAGASSIPAGYFRGQQSFDTGLLDLVMAQRRGALSDELATVLVAVTDRVSFIPGIRAHTQASSLTGLWEPLADVLADLDRNGQDVIVDAGRLGLPGFASPVFLTADLALLTTRSHLPALAAARSWAGTLKEDFANRGTTANLGLGVIGPGQPYGSREASKTLGLPVALELSWDPVSAEVYSRGATPSRKFETSTLNNSLRAAVSKLTNRITSTRQAIDLEEPADV